jgi:hypothetical protein
MVSWQGWDVLWWVIVKLRWSRFGWVGSSVSWTNHVELVYVVQYVSWLFSGWWRGKRSREGLCRCTTGSEGRTRTLGLRDRGRDDHGSSTSSTRMTRGFAEGVKMALTQVKVGSRQVKCIDIGWFDGFSLKTTSERFLCFGLKTGVANWRTHVILWSLCQGEAMPWRH